MIDLYELAQSWQTKNPNGSYTVPADVPFAKEGSTIWVGIGARIGDYASIGDDARIGDYARIGQDASIGSYASIGDYASIGQGARIGPRAESAIDIGHADGYRKCLCNIGQVAWIGAGCRWFTLAEALEHWGDDPERVDTMALMQSAIAIAKLRGWSHE